MCNAKTILSVMILLCLWDGHFAHAAEMKPQSVHQVQAMQTTLNGKPFDFEYLLFRPENYNQSDALFPLILFLHGSGARGNDVQELRNHHLPIVLEDKPQFPAIVLSPQCPNGASWEDQMLDKLDELLKKVVSENRVDTDRIYLTGLSMGGYGTWNMLRRHPSWFAAFASVCGATGDQADQMKAFTQIPGWAYHGEDDMIVPINVSLQAVDAFRKAGGTIQMTAFPGVAHNAWEPAYDVPELFLWLLNHKKNQPAYQYEMDAQTRTFFEHWQVGQSYLLSSLVTPFPLDNATHPIQVQRINTSRFNVTETMTWQSDNPFWSITPSQKRFEIAAGQKVQQTFHVTYSGGRHDLNPLPKFNAILQVGEKPIKRFNGTLSLDDKAYFRKHLLTHGIPALAQPPVIDADLSDTVWANVPELSALQQVDGKGPSPVITHVKIAYDQTCLYLAMHAVEPNPEKLVKRNTKRDSSVYRDDNFAFYIQPDPEADTYYHTVVNPIGTIMDGLAHNRGWNSAIQLKTRINQDNWCAELAIPWSSLGMTSPQKAARIGFEFECSRKQSNTSGQWTPSYGTAHQPNRFGQLIFE